MEEINEEFINRANEYDKMALALDEELLLLGLNSNQISGDLDNLLTVFAKIAVILGVKNPTISNIYLAISDIEMKLLDENFIETTLNDENELINECLREANEKRDYLRIIVKRLEDASLMIDNETNIMVLRANKNINSFKELDAQITEDKQRLSSFGYSEDSSITHTAMAKDAEILMQNSTELKRLSDELQGYKLLPPDFNLAQIEIEKMRRKLGELTEKFNKKLHDTVKLSFL